LLEGSLHPTVALPGQVFVFSRNAGSKQHAAPHQRGGAGTPLGGQRAAFRPV